MDRIVHGRANDVGRNDDENEDQRRDPGMS